MEVILLKFVALLKAEGALAVIGLSVAMGLVKTIAVLMGYVTYDTRRSKREIAWLVFWEVLGMVLVTIPIAILVGLITLSYTDGHEGKALLATALFAIIGRSIMDTLVKLRFDKVMNAGLEGAAGVLQKWPSRGRRDNQYEPYRDKYNEYYDEPRYDDNDFEYRERSRREESAEDAPRS